ncbi:hypothetical protein D3C80_1961620 [compost metagenome]
MQIRSDQQRNATGRSRSYRLCRFCRQRLGIDDRLEEHAERITDQLINHPGSSRQNILCRSRIQQRQITAGS